MANNENLIPFTSNQSREEAVRNGRKGGKASGEARRKKANFRKTLNALLTAEIDNTEWTPLLQALGVDSTLEAAVNMAMIKEALMGNVKAYTAIKDVLGQTSKSDTDLEEQQLRMAATRAKMGVEDDGFLDALNETAADDWSDDESLEVDDEEETSDI